MTVEPVEPSDMFIFIDTEFITINMITDEGKESRIVSCFLKNP